MISEFPIDDGAYLAYQVADDAKTAVSLRCETFNPTSCEKDPLGITFTVLENQLIYTESVSQTLQTVAQSGEVTDSGCNLDLTATWNIADEGETMKFNVDFLYGLSGSTTDCPRFQQQLIDSSKNGEGIEGCTVTLAMQGRLP